MDATQDSADAARKALAAIEGFAADSPSARITPLRGLTNRVFKVETASGTFSLRIPGAGTADIIDRRAEELNARAAAAAGVAPEVVYFGADGVMVTRFIAGATLSPSRFREDAGALGRAAAALRHLHHEAPAFAREFRVFEIADTYVGLLARRGASLRPEHADLLRRAAPLRDALAARPAASRSCHCDPSCGNLIDDGARVWLIDWEYSAMNDPMWDLAYLAIEADLDADLERRLLAAYFGRTAQGREAARMEAYKVLCRLLSGLWALVQHAGGNRSSDYLSYAEATLAQCRQRLSDPGLSEVVKVLRMA